MPEFAIEKWLGRHAMLLQEADEGLQHSGIEKVYVRREHASGANFRA